MRELDLAQTRVHETMRRIHMVVDRSHCIDGVRDALSEGDLERAAQCVAKFLELEEATKDIADVSSTQAQEQRQVGPIRGCWMGQGASCLGTTA